MIPFGKFIPAYHHHFGRQCRVSDYGFTKLIDLFEALPSVVQVLGEGQKRVVTLTHRAQVRRFSCDLLRVVKSQSNMQLALSEFATLYQKLNNKSFEIFDFGVCCVHDLLADLSESVVKVSSFK
jgi:meiosis arrest female protein 1